MSRRAAPERFFEDDSEAANEDGEGGVERPEVAVSSVAERMGLVGWRKLV